MDAVGNGASTSRNASAIAPPPVPPRPNETNVTPFYGGQPPYSSAYGSGSMYGSSPYGYGSFGTYGGYGSTPYGAYGSYGRPLASGADSDFVRIAEQHSRNTLQSLEAVVTTVSSVSMMLESSLSAVHAAWRAALFVADQGHRARAQFLMLIQGAIKIIRKILAWILVGLRLRPANYYRSIDDDWLSATAGVPQSMGSPAGGIGSRPTFASVMVLAVAIGGPWLLYKLIAKVVQDVEDSRQWAHGVGEHYEAVVQHNFTAASQAELSVQAGDRLRIAPKQRQPAVRGWILAAVVRPVEAPSPSEPPTIGLVPLNYIRVTERHARSTPALRHDDSFAHGWNEAGNK